MKNSYNPAFVTFAAERMRTQGETIIKWSQTDNPLLAQTCKEIIEAANLFAGKSCAVSCQNHTEANFQDAAAQK